MMRGWVLIALLAPAALGAGFSVSPPQPTACHVVVLRTPLQGSGVTWEVTAADLGRFVGEGAEFHWRPCFPGTYTVRLLRDGEPVFSGEITVRPLPPELLRPGDILCHPAVYSPLFEGVPRSLSFPLGHMGLVTCDFRVLEAHLLGVRGKDTVEAFVSRYRGERVWVLRVGVPPAERARALAFARAQIGKPYDPFFVAKEIFGRAYYCSELVWAAYEVGSGAERTGGGVRCGAVDLDPSDGSGCGDGPVSPEEIAHSPWIEIVGYLVPPIRYREGIPVIRPPGAGGISLPEPSFEAGRGR